jgi:HK97 family phage prohead protease
MQHVRIKQADGTSIDKDMDGEEVVAWFKDNSKDGAVTTDITLFTEAAFDVTKQEDSVDWVMSDMSLDRDQERVDPDGADFKNFKKNPVVLWAHDYARPAIGKIANPKVKDGRVTGKVEFDSKDNDEFAYMVGQKVKKGFISAGSIGFKPNTVEFVDEPKDSTRLVHRKWELMEFSICNVPSNPNAMAVRAEDDMDAKKVAELEAKVVALETELAKEKEAHNVYAKLFEDKRETSVGTSTLNDKVDDVSVQGLFDASESSAQKQTDKAFDLMFAK